MRNLNYLTIGRRALRCLMLFAFGYLSLNSMRIYAQGLVASPKNSTVCSGVWHCCQQLKYTAPAGGVDKIDITCGTTTAVPPPSCNCWDWACKANWVTSQVPAPAIVVTNNNPGWTITFTPALAAGQTFTIILCPKLNNDGCAYQWASFQWDGYLGVNPVDPAPPPPPAVWQPGFTPIYQCDANDGTHKNSICPGCDRVDLYNNLPCDERVCITRHWPSNPALGKTFDITFSPALQACNGSITGCLEEYGLTGPTLDPDEVTAGWTLVPNPPGQTTTYTLHNNTAGLEGCFSICFDIPACNPPINHTVTINNPNDPNNCGESSASASFKKASGAPSSTGNQENQNFPNPVTSATQFKTTIPFEIPTGGIAKVTVLDASGKTIFTYTQEFAGGGKHFFYFTGEQLPSGKYFYTIESPLGKTIVSKSLLIVK
jgi:hypothetical protein